jgi:RNA polymerase sigma-70 factor (ECF subfamily)
MLPQRMREIEALYRSRYVGFRNALIPVVGSREAAHDVVQEAFAVALREHHNLRVERSLAPWVWRIAYRLALRERARAQPGSLHGHLLTLDEHRDPEVAAAIKTLAPRRRLVVFLRYFADFSYGEIAEALDISEGTVAATLAQARSALLDELAPEEVAR